MGDSDDPNERGTTEEVSSSNYLGAIILREESFYGKRRANDKLGKTGLAKRKLM